MTNGRANTEIIRFFADALGIKVEIVLASELQAKGTGTELLLHICEELDADIYLSGRFGRDYLKEETFSETGIRVVYQDFHHLEYEQLFKPFVPEMAGVDFLFNLGASGVELIKRGWEHER